MDIKDIIAKINISISEVIKNDISILERGLNEEIISNAISHYLKPLFQGYDVNAEYNGDVQNEGDRKKIIVDRRRILEIKKKSNKNNIYKLSPDIIIHKQGTNDENLVIFEVKKDTHEPIGKEYDLIKLEHMTINYLENHYNYKLGVAIIFGTLNNAGKYDVIYFQEGVKTELSNLK
jgi:hypothetical protein